MCNGSGVGTSTPRPGCPLRAVRPAPGAYIHSVVALDQTPAGSTTQKHRFPKSVWPAPGPCCRSVAPGKRPSLLARIALPSPSGELFRVARVVGAQNGFFGGPRWSSTASSIVFRAKDLLAALWRGLKRTHQCYKYVHWLSSVPLKYRCRSISRKSDNPPRSSSG